MKKSCLIFLFLLSTFSLTFSQLLQSSDLRRSFLLCVEGDSEISTLLEQSLEVRIEKQGKYKVLTKEDIFFDSIREFIGEYNQSNINKDVDFLVHIEILESFPNMNWTVESRWWEYKLLVKSNVIQISSGESISSKIFSTKGTSYIKPYQNFVEAIFIARRNAIENISSSILSQLNSLFKIKANITRIEDKYAYVDAGKSIGVYKGMMFEFVDSKEIDGVYYDLFDGKLIVEEVWDNGSKLKILEKPKEFDYSGKDIYVVENSRLSPIRSIISVYYANENLRRNGVGFEMGVDTYNNFYVGNSFETFFMKDIFTTDINFKIAYLHYFDDVNSTLLMGALLGLKSTFNSNNSNIVYFKIAPIIDYSHYFTNSFGINFEAGYNILIPFESSSEFDLGNNFRVGAGILFRF